MKSIALQIDVDLDKITIAKQMIKRPDYISRSEWLKFWEEPVKEKTECEICGEWIG